MSGRTVVLSPAPTANGDLHLGHLAGPFLGADVYTRYARATGRKVLFGTGHQGTPTYVVTTAHRLGTPPAELVAKSGADIEKTLAALGIEVDGYTGVGEQYSKVVVDYGQRLYAAGSLRARTMAFPYAPRRDEYLVDGHVRGRCPVCLADSCAGLCESCGHPVLAGDLLDPRSTRFPDDPVELREAQVLVLPMEEYRDRLTAHFAEHAGKFRPHMAQLIEELLARPLVDFPLTFPLAWGTPAPFAETPGQVFNPNAEALTWSLHSVAVSAGNRGLVLSREDELWLADADTEMVYFLGFDNTYPFAVAGLAMLLAAGEPYRLPSWFLTNEFYELEHEKFSTSRGHVVWGRDLAAEVPRDLIRFSLAASSPEHQRTNFSADGMRRVTAARLVEPFHRIVSTVDELVGRGPLPVSARSREAAARLAERFAACYELPRFSLNRATETLTEQLARLAAADPGLPGDLCHEVDVLLRCAAPILIDLAAEAGVDPAFPTGPGPSEVVPRALPRLAG